MKDLDVFSIDRVSEKTKGIYDDVILRLRQVPVIYSYIPNFHEEKDNFPTFEECFRQSNFSFKENKAIQNALSLNQDSSDAELSRNVLDSIKGSSVYEPETTRNDSSELKDLASLVFLASELAQENREISEQAVVDFFSSGYNWFSFAELIGIVIMKSIANFKFIMTGPELGLAG